MTPGAARPRQTDVVAESPDATYVIEVKWTGSKAGPAVVSQLVDRIGRMPAGAFGIVICVNGFTDPLIDDLEHRREQGVLLLDGEELVSLLPRRADPARGASTQARRARAARAGRPRDPPRRRRAAASPRSGQGRRHACALRRGRRPWITGGGSLGSSTFVLRLADHAAFDEENVSLDIPLPLADIDALVDALCELSALGWATPAGTWSIRQSGAAWHGLGAASLVTALRGRDARYAPLLDPHHHEQVSYHDVCDGGFYTMAFDVSIPPDTELGVVELSMQLAGVPVDPEPLRELCRTFGVGPGLFYRSHRHIEYRGEERLEHTPVEPLARIVEHGYFDPERECVTGVVAANPFAGARETTSGGTGAARGTRVRASAVQAA